MKKRLLFIFALISALLIFVIFKTLSVNNPKYIDLPSLEQKDKRDLNKEQYLDDFRFVYNTLNEYYPYFDVNKKIDNINWLAKKDEFEDYIQKSKNDVDFGLRMNKILYELNNDHTQLVDQNQAIDMYITYYKVPEYNWRHDISHIYEKENVRRRYGLTNKKINNYLKYYDLNENFDENKQFNLKGESSSKPISNDNIKMQDIDKNIAYIKINKMINYDRSYQDQKLIKKYLKTIKNKKALVIDIRGNQGGDSNYWQQFLLPSIIDKPYNSKYYNFIKHGKLNNKVISQEKYQDGVSRILESTNFDDETKEVLSKFDYYKYYTSNVTPSEDSIKFTGNIYLLVDSSVYSSAEMLASFCSETKLATLVGEKTGGDGIGTDPMQIDLPNSGYVLRFPKEIGLTNSGKINEIEKTSPDIFIDSNPYDNLLDQPIIHKIIELESQ